jgi:UDP-N-acetylglucosamine 2-epimerase (non-hydrolysing)
MIAITLAPIRKSSKCPRSSGPVKPWGEDYFTLHTGQHYSYEMDRALFEDLELPQPEYNLDVGSGTHAEQTGKIMTGIEKILLKEKPGIVLVQGDTNTVLAGPLTASKLHIKFGHVAAGLRSFDRRMPEEINRIVADHISNTLFPRTELAKKNLMEEDVLAGTDPDAMFSCAKKMLVRGRPWANPFGDGKAGERVIQITLEGCS